MIECIFGVLKQKFHILLLPVEYDMEIQARLLAALSAIHNFTRDHDSEISEYNGPNIDYEIYHQGGGGHFEAEGLGGDDPEGAAKRNIIAEHMWRDYQEYIAGMEEDEETDISEEE